MSGPPSSFFSGGSEVTELGFSVPMEAADGAARGVYDASRFRERHRERYEIVVRLLGLGVVSHAAIAEIAGCSWETVRAVATEATPSIREKKARLALKLTTVVEAGLDDMLERITHGKLELAPADLRFLGQLLADMDGSPQQTVRVIHEVDPAVAALRAELASGMVSTGGKVSAFGRSAGPLVEAETGDFESPDSAAQPACNVDGLSISTEIDTEARPDFDGGGGGGIPLEDSSPRG